jgi:hypothetical protein
MGWRSYVKFKIVTKKINNMKGTKTIQPSKLWHVTSIKDLENIKENGIYNFGRRLKLIHRLQFGINPMEKYDYFSSADCLGLRVVENINNLQYALIEVSPEGLKSRLKSCNTEGEVVAKCTYETDLFHIEPEYVVGYEIRTINLDDLLFFNEWRLRNCVHSELIQSKQPGYGLDQKETAQNNRISNERQCAICFNVMLFNLVYGDYQLSRFKSFNTESVELINVA